jgi:hypothetical protein
VLSPLLVLEGRTSKKAEMTRFIAARVEAITDDDDELSSLCFWWGDIGSYFALARELDSNQIHCEYRDQMNGFYSDTISYSVCGSSLIFSLAQDESFERDASLKTIEIDLRNIESYRDEIDTCLNSIFST